jgi:hypothetical protein
MSNIINEAVNFVTFGAVDDVTGVNAAGQAGQQAAQLQADVAREGIAAAKEQQLFERQNTKLDRKQSTDRYREQIDTDKARYNQQTALNQDRYDESVGRYNQSYDENISRYNTSQGRLDQERADNAPRIEAGQQATAQQQALLGLSGQDAQKAAYGGIQESAGQRFLRERQQRALVRNSSAMGGLGGGNVRTALQEQAAGFAMQDVDNQFNRLSTVAAQGTPGAPSQNPQMVQNPQVGSQVNSSGGNFNTNVNTNTSSNSAGNIINAQSNLGAAQASGILAPAQANAAFNNQLLQLGGTVVGANSDRIYDSLFS